MSHSTAMAGRPEPVDQQALVVVLGEAEHERVRAEALADVTERDDGHLARPVAEVEAIEPEAAGDDVVGDAELAVELEGAGLDGHRAGRLARAGVSVDQAERTPRPRQPEGEDQAGRAGADDQDVAVHAVRSVPRWRT